LSPESIALGNDLGAGAPEREAAREKAAEEAAEAAIKECLAAETCGTDPATLVLLSRARTEALLGALELGDGSQTTAVEAIADFLGIDFGPVSYLTSIWIDIFTQQTAECLSKIGAESEHGACLFEFQKLEWEGELVEGVSGKVHFEVYDGFYNIFPCYKQHGTTVKNLLVCPDGNSDYVFPNR
jgi:hypothetical protein